MTKEIKPNAVYTTEETQEILKVSKSTIKRLLKKGIIKANKVGGQYRILGKELLLLVSPRVERKVAAAYRNLKEKTKDRIKDW